MAEFKNLTSQIQVIDSPFSDTITYHKKSNSDSVVQLGVSASNSEVILSKVDANGNTGAELARYKFAEVTAPSLATLDLLVEQINTWIHDEVKEVTISTPFTGTMGIFGELKMAKNYSFDAITNKLTIDEGDLDFVVSVFNETLNKVVYIKGSEEYKATIAGNEITLTVRFSDAGNGDTLCITYKSKPEEDEKPILESILKELETNNKILNKIYNPK
jgi:hypothetical protein